MKTARNKGSVRKDEIRKFRYKCLISGSTATHDEKQIETHIVRFIKDWGLTKDNTIFLITLIDKNNENLLSNWCERNGYQWHEPQIEWSNLKTGRVVEKTNKDGEVYNSAAPYERNSRLSKISTHGLIFYNGKDKITEDLIKCCNDNHVRIRMIRHN